MRHDGRSGRALILAALCGCGGGRALDPGPTLQVTGESTKLRRSDPLPWSSPFFDGAQVHLRAARGEILGVAVWRRGGAAAPVSLTIDGATVQGFAVDHLPVVRPSTSMYGHHADGRGDWPDRLRPVDGAVSADRVAFFDVSSTSAGAHDGTLQVGDARFPVHLTVDPVTMPSISDALRVWGYFDAKEVGADAPAVSATMAAHGVAACPEDAREGPCLRLPYHPVEIPDDPAEVGDAVRAWAGTTPTPFAIPIDEPHSPADRQRVRALADAVHAAAGGKPFLYAVTDKPDPIYGDAVDVYISALACTLAQPSPTRWTYNGGEPTAGPMILDAEGVAMRTWGWIAWRYQIPLWYIWDVAYWSDRYHGHRGQRSDLDRDAVSFDDGDDHGDLDGVLIYPGGLPSWRLEALRRGLEDRALLDALAACAGRDAADQIASAMVPRALGDLPDRSAPAPWPHDEASWEAARVRLLDALDACAK